MPGTGNTAEAAAAGARDARVDPAAPLGGLALGLHEGLSHPDPENPLYCARWPEALRLWCMRTGELVRGRCKATNLCEYCCRLYVMECVEMLWLDACEHEAPTVYACLGTRTATSDPRPFYRGRELVMRALRRHWPARYASTSEFTTGRGRRSEGKRRPHWNLMLKGIPLDALDQARDVIAPTWCRHVDAEPDAQDVRAIYQAGGLARYMLDHFLKESQAPPAGWRGQRFNASRDYFAPLSRAEARLAARDSLRLKRAIWEVEQDPDVPSDAVLDLAHAVKQLSDAKAWDLADVAEIPTDWTPDGLPAATQLQVVGLVSDRRRP